MGFIIVKVEIKKTKKLIVVIVNKCFHQLQPSAGVEPKRTFSQNEAKFPTERLSQFCHTQSMKLDIYSYKMNDIIFTRSQLKSVTIA